MKLTVQPIIRRKVYVRSISPLRSVSVMSKTLFAELTATVAAMFLFVYRRYKRFLLILLFYHYSSCYSMLFLPDPCRNSPCANGGTCLVEGHVYKCKCTPGWGGEECRRKYQLQNILPDSAVDVNATSTSISFRNLKNALTLFTYNINRA